MTGDSTTTEFLTALLAGARGGDKQASDRLLAYANERLRALVGHQLRGFPAVRRWEETDDVLQGVLLRLSRALADVSVQDTRHFLALSGQLIRRELIDLKRHLHGPEGMGAHHATDAGSDHDHSRASPGMDRYGTESGEASALAQWTEFHQRVENLPCELREVVNLLWYQTLSHDEAAVLLGTSAKTIQRRWRTARLTLGSLLQE